MATESCYASLFKDMQLEKSRQQIRLLRFRRVENSIHCEISIHDLTTPPSYKALSYCWGDPGSSHNILIKNRPFAISTNLFLFLEKYTTTQSCENYLWIDQISINQSLIEEKNHQVRLMSQIYKTANAVLIWLGDTTRHYDTAEMARMESNRLLSTIGHLVDDSYFSRLWVVQECLLARRLEVLAPGTGRIDWDELEELIDSLSKTKEGRVLLMMRTEVFDLFRYRSAGKMSLMKYVSSFCGKDCADPRDRIYGLMGLVDDNESIPIDYQKTLKEIFSDLAMVHLTKIRTALKSDRDLQNERYYFETMIRRLKLSPGLEGAHLTELWNLISAFWRLPSTHSHHGELFPYSPKATKIGYAYGVRSIGCPLEWTEFDDYGSGDYCRPIDEYSIPDLCEQFVGGQRTEVELFLDRWWYECCGVQHFPEHVAYAVGDHTYKVLELEL